MKNRKNRVLALALAVIMAFGLAAPAVAAGQTFSDVPSTFWGYADIEAAAAAGLMNGTGNGEFSPNLKVSVAQFLTLLGRLVFPETTVGANDIWYGPYVAACQNAGFLTGTQVNASAPEAEITRYDMAVILRAAAKKLGVAEKVAQNSEVTDYGVIPNMYTDAVLAVYGMGLIKGDQAGNFNGSNAMMRSEVATVIMRLAKTKPSGTTDPGTTTEPEKPEFTEPLEPEIVPMPDEEEMVSRTLCLRIVKVDHAIGRPRDDKYTYLTEVPVKLFYTPDGGKTAILVTEFNSPTKDASGELIYVTFDAPESWSSYTSYKNGGGFYFSAETVLDGQRLVTSDLRTDGRAYVSLQRLAPSTDPRMPIRYDVELTPTDGEKAKFTYQGHIETMLPGRPYVPLPGFSIQLHLADGRVVAEAVSKEDGTFSMECEVDALDGGLDHEGKYYYTTASGYFEGELYERSGKNISGNLMLESLVDLNVVDSYGLPRQRADDTITMKRKSAQ